MFASRIANIILFNGFGVGVTDSSVPRKRPSGKCQWGHTVGSTGDCGKLES